MITGTPQNLAISCSSSNFISNVGLTRNKMHDIKFNQVRTSFCQIFTWCCPGLNWRPSACSPEVLTVTPPHFVISALSSTFLSNFGLTRNKMHDFKFNPVKTSICQKLSLMLSRLDFEILCVLSRSDNRYPTAPCD